jgi:hypothetical protein
MTWTTRDTVEGQRPMVVVVVVVLLLWMTWSSPFYLSLVGVQS